MQVFLSLNIINKDSYDDYFEFVIKSDKGNSEVIFEETDDINTIQYTFKERSYLFDNLVYLGSERSLSKNQIRGNLKNIELGKNNEYLAYILEKGQKRRIECFKERSCPFFEETTLLDVQINYWLEYVLPGNYVSTKSLSEENFLSLFFGKKSDLHQANIGYGVSYILPIIIAGLITKPGSLLIIENPELHLHPYAQSCIAYFLAYISSRGVQVIVETHSEHIVNGYRKATLDESNNLTTNDIDIHYFSSDPTIDVETVTLNTKAEINHWPIGFMDQMEKDLFEIRKMRLANG